MENTDNQGDGGWRISTRCSHGECIKVAKLKGRVRMGTTTAKGEMTVSPDVFSTFTDGIKDGTFQFGSAQSAAPSQNAGIGVG